MDYALTLSAEKGDIYYTTDVSDPRNRGSISDTASLYDTGIPLNEPSTQVHVRVRLGSEWSAIDKATFIVEPTKPSPTSLAITEILYDPIAANENEIAAGFEDADFEFLEVRNLHKTQPVKLAGLRFTEGIEFSFPSELVLDPGSYAVLVANRRAFESRNGSKSTILGEFKGKSQWWRDSPAHYFRRICGAEFRYDTGSEWPAGADGEGKSIVLLDPESQPDPSDPSSWKASSEVGGSPGEQESSTVSDEDTNGLLTNGRQFFGNTNQSHDGDFDKEVSQTFLSCFRSVNKPFG